MSDTPQDENTSRVAPEVVAKEQPATQRQFESTPAKKKYGPDLAFTSTAANYDKVRKQLASEMEGRWLGAMPVSQFLDRYLKTAENSAPLPTLAKDPFSAVPSGGLESARYDPFMTAIAGWIPHLQAVNTSTKEDITNKLKLKPDVSLYNRAEGVAPQNNTDFARMELWMEFKSNSGGVAFRDPDDTTDESRRLAIEQGSFTPATVDAINARGQLAHYAGAQHSLQFRHFSFSVIIEGNRARFLRWDPAGTIVTAAFNYRTNPEILAEFLWRFDQLTPKDRGYDESIRPAQLEEDANGRVREKLQVKDKKTPLFEYDVLGLDGMGHAYGPRPPYQNRSLVSRCTRSLPVVWIPKAGVQGGTKSCTESESALDTDAQPGRDNTKEDETDPWSKERIVYMKDTWRFLSDSQNVEVLPEHEIYATLHKAKTPNIPQLVVGADVRNGKTKTQEMATAPWLCVTPRVSSYQHYRLVLGIVGHALTTFRCTKELVTGVLDAMKAHWHAFNVAKILHRDISVGNILLTDEGRGLLIDWELAKWMHEVGSRRPDRTGTWQFMSANLLQHAGRMHMLEDDLESFLHVLGWTILRYVPASDSYEAEDRGGDMTIFDEYSVRKGCFNRGGSAKSLILGAGKYPSQRFHPRQFTPLCGLLRTLSSPFKSLYASDPPDEVLREDYEELKRTNPDNERAYVNHIVHIYDQGMERLKASLWFITTIENALAKEAWSTDDKAVRDLPIRSSFSTDGQDIRRTSQFQNTYSQWERSKGLPRSSKRAASPTPESNSKRRCYEPTGSGSGN